MRRNLAVGAAVACGTALVSLLFVSSALALTVTGFSPNSGLPNKDNGQACPGNTIMITGSGFVNDGPASAVQVSFNGTPVQPGGLQIGNDSTLYAIVPDGATTGPITVTDAAGSVTASGGLFYVNPCPQVALSVAEANPSAAAGVSSTPSFLGRHSVQPTSGPAGATVTLTGYDFLNVTAVAFGTASAKFSIVSPTKITVTVPKGAATGKIKVTYKINATVSEAGINPNPTVNGNPGNSAAVTYTPAKFKVT
jgi:hypothetical protein